MRTALANHGRREAKNLGDGLMAVLFESVGGPLAGAGAMQRAFVAARRVARTCWACASACAPAT